MIRLQWRHRLSMVIRIAHKGRVRDMHRNGNGNDTIGMLKNSDVGSIVAR